MSGEEMTGILNKLKRERDGIEEVMRNGRKRVNAINRLLEVYNVPEPIVNGARPSGQTKQAQKTAREERRDKIAAYLRENGPAGPTEIANATKEEPSAITMLLNTSPLFNKVQRGLYEVVGD